MLNWKRSGQQVSWLDPEMRNFMRMKKKRMINPVTSIEIEHSETYKHEDGDTITDPAWLLDFLRN